MRLFITLIIVLFTPVTASAYEGAGLLVSDQQGALPKALWRDQPRSEIAYLLKNLPADSSMRSVQTIKRNMLLSYYDTSLIENDVEPSHDNDLLTLRLNKLFEMGFWADALKLYTKNVTDPGGNEPLARIGMLLTMTQRGIATTCLEEKVIGNRYKNQDFWINLGAICEREIYGTSKKPLSNSSVLEAIYYNNDFQIPSSDVGALEKLGLLERIMLMNKNRIRFNADLPERTPAFFIQLYLLNKELNESEVAKLKERAVEKALLPLLSTKKTKNLENLSDNELTKLFSTELRQGLDLTPKTLDELTKRILQKPGYSVYLQTVKHINTYTSAPTKETYNFNNEKYNFNKKQKEILIYLTESLDKPPEFSNNRRNVYEKRLSLTPDDEYGMSKRSLTEEYWQNWLTDTTKHNFAGLTLLIVLSNLENIPSAEENNNNSGDKPETKKVNVLQSLGNVGLNNQVQRIAREILASSMNQ